MKGTDAAWKKPCQLVLISSFLLSPQGWPWDSWAAGIQKNHLACNYIYLCLNGIFCKGISSLGDFDIHL